MESVGQKSLCKKHHCTGVQLGVRRLSSFQILCYSPTKGSGESFRNDDPVEGFDRTGSYYPSPKTPGGKRVLLPHFLCEKALGKVLFDPKPKNSEQGNKVRTFSIR